MPDLLSQAVTQLLERDWRAQPKHKASWQRYWRGMSLPSTFVYEGAIVPTKTTSEIAWHPGWPDVLQDNLPSQSRHAYNS